MLGKYTNLAIVLEKIQYVIKHGKHFLSILPKFVDQKITCDW